MKPDIRHLVDSTGNQLSLTAGRHDRAKVPVTQADFDGAPMQGCSDDDMMKPSGEDLR
ncbi:hypothetical protein MJD09_07085 [bacterium]|nr:hypothetical protein [bacterium]